MSLLPTWRAVGGLLLIAALTGCATQAPPYAPTVDNADTLKQRNVPPMKLGSFTVQPGATGATSIGLRGNPMQSPVGADFAAYLADALRKELVLAGKLDPASGTEVAGQLLKNDIAAAGIVTNSGEIEARFIVSRAGQVRYDQVLRAEMSWDSSLMGAIAIPKAVQTYPLLVQKLLATLFADSRFLAAVQ
jgi:hypothetical protein